MRRIVQAMYFAEYSDGLGLSSEYDKTVYLDNPSRLRKALLQVKQCIDFVPCGDVSQLKLDQIDEDVIFSPRREIARSCKQLLTMKAPHGKRRWGIGLTPSIQEMLEKKTHQLIDSMVDNSVRVAKYHKQSGFVEIGFSRYVGHIVSVAIQLLPSNKQDFKRIYTEIWLKRERDRSYPSNRNQKVKEKFHNQCLSVINNLKLDNDGLPVSSLTMLEPSFLAELQKVHWQSPILRSGKITSKGQQAAFKAFINLKKMAEGRSSDESKHFNKVILSFIENVEVSDYWLQLLSNEFQVYQQITCHDWSRLEGISTKKINELVDLLSEYVYVNSEINLRMAILRLLLPLVESWVLCILLERKLKKESISQNISAGLKELKEYIEYVKPELLDTFNQLKQFARPYGTVDANEK